MMLRGYKDFSLNRALGAFCADESGATAIEYGLMASLIAVVCIGAFKKVGGSNNTGWQGMTVKAGAAMR